MVAPRRTKKVICTVVRVSVDGENVRQCLSNRLSGRFSTSFSSQPRFSTKPSDLLPWADPYISRLVTNLQSEVRLERELQQISRQSGRSATMDLDPPNPCTEPYTDVEREEVDLPRWDFRDEPSTDFSE